MTRPLLATPVLALTAACGPAMQSAPAPAVGTVRVALVDTVPYATEMHDGVLHRVEVRSAAGVDTLDGVLTRQLPIVLADGRVMGFAWEAADLREAFAYHPAWREVRRLALPDDADRWFTTPAFSPDGRYLAYVAYVKGSGMGMIREGTRGEIVLRTVAVPVPATDAAMSFAQWLDAETFEIYLDVGETGWHRFLGTVSGGVTLSDTLTLPDIPRGAEPLIRRRRDHELRRCGNRRASHGVNGVNGVRAPV